MQLFVNGETIRFHEFRNPLLLKQMLEMLGYEPKSIAVAINGQFIPKHQYSTFQIAEEAEIEVLAPMQGG